jgi:hypothetical protein
MSEVQMSLLEPEELTGWVEMIEMVVTEQELASQQVEMIALVGMIQLVMAMGKNFPNRCC